MHNSSVVDGISRANLESVRPISEDTQLCMSLASNPSSIGTRFHNFLYDELDLDYVYKAFTTTELAGALTGMRALGIRGCGISMPFKQAALALVDELDESAAAIGAINTIVNTAGHLLAYNTDHLAVAALLAEHRIPPHHEFAVLGSGGMARAVVAALRAAGFVSGVIVTRNPSTGAALAEDFGYGWQHDLGERRPALIVNATPVGMAGGPAPDAQPVPADAVAAAETIFDVVAMPARTPLVELATSLGRHVITGDLVLAGQAAEQFFLYTGVRPSHDQVRRAASFSRLDP